MTRETLASGERPLLWIASSQKDMTRLPVAVQRSFGYALGYAQFGGKHPNAKPWKGEGPGVLEIVQDHRGDTFRAVYTVRFEKAVYVLHVFQKKSKQGIKTNRTDKDLIAGRLREAEKQYEEEFG